MAGPGWFCLALLAEDIDTTFCFAFVGSSCCAGSRKDDFDSVFPEWLDDGTMSGQILFDGAVAQLASFSLQFKVGFVTGFLQRGSAKELGWRKMTRLSKVGSNGGRFCFCNTKPRSARMLNWFLIVMW